MKQNPFLHHPFRDELAAAIRRAEHLSQENAALRTTLAGRRPDWVQWMLIGLIMLCAVAILCILKAG